MQPSKIPLFPPTTNFCPCDSAVVTELSLLFFLQVLPGIAHMAAFIPQLD
jgi:hypothetical protein